MKLILSIETSCDETSLALLIGPVKNPLNQSPAASVGFLDYINSFEIISQLVSSQIKEHRKFGGVVPEIGARLHAFQIHFLLDQLLFAASFKIAEKLQNGDKYRENVTEIESEGLELIIKKWAGASLLENNGWVEYFKEKNISELELIKDPKNWLGLIDEIMVTTSPGLAASLRVGTETAKSLIYFINQKHKKNVVFRPINHLHGHIASCFFE